MTNNYSNLYLSRKSPVVKSSCALIMSHSDPVKSCRVCLPKAQKMYFVSALKKCHTTF